MQITATAAPAFIAPDTYRGRQTVTHATDARLGRRTASWLAENIGEGNTGVLWECSGHTLSGRLLYCRTRFVAHEGTLRGYDSDGALKVIHSADRVIGFVMSVSA